MKKTNPKVLMFGWEFPPKNTGGLGTACHGLINGLTKNKVKITLVLPYDIENADNELLRIISTGDVKVRKVKTILTPYMDYRDYQTKRTKHKSGQIYGRNLFEEVNRYAEIGAEIAKKEYFDLIHCHDWMTFKAGINAKALTKKPLIIHVHSTEFDRSGGHGANQYVYDIEKHGMHYANHIIAVSNYTKNMIIRYYGISPEKIHVVHNAVEHGSNPSLSFIESKIKQNNKIVLFLGRITLQKGPDYFIYAAKKALEIEPNIIFVIAGNGDMEPFIIEKAVEFGIVDKVIFTGFLSNAEVDTVYKMADLYIMPSVSEPFGITTLEAMKNGTPVIISKQSGVSEVINHCLKVDFWDISQIVNKMVSVLRYSELEECLSENAREEVKKFSWDISAKRCLEVYKRVNHLNQSSTCLG